MKNLILVMLVFLGTTSIKAQSNVLNDLQFYADVIANAGNPLHKQRAHESFSKAFDQWIVSDQFNINDLESIQWLSVKAPEDESFRLITWQLNLEENDNQYFGYLLKNGNAVKLVNATDLEDIEYDVLSAEDWAGALYYNILTVEKEGKKHYILFGYNAYKNFEHRKIADVLTFEGEEAIFGAELFKRQEKGERGVVKNRLVLDYSNDSNVSLNFDLGLDMIVHDHLIARMGRVPGQGPTMLPDGSYVGYKWDGSHFNYIKKIYNQTQDAPPFPTPVLGKDKSSNIFGQKKKIKKKRN